jgi:conjugative transfer signal peptidase TraF
VKAHSRISPLIVWLTLFLSLGIGGMWAFDCIINVTPSMPIGLWRITKPIPPLESLRHKVILFCPPDTEIFRWAKSNGVLTPGRCPGDYTPLLKEVIGLPGESVEIRDGAVLLFDHPLPNSGIDPKLRLTSLTPKQTIPSDSLWVMGTASPASFDSRYFGPISSDSILGLAYPVFTSHRYESLGPRVFAP